MCPNSRISSAVVCLEPTTTAWNGSNRASMPLGPSVYYRLARVSVIRVRQLIAATLLIYSGNFHRQEASVFLKEYAGLLRAIDSMIIGLDATNDGEKV